MLERPSAGFERDPFKWTTDGRTSQVRIGFSWSWLTNTQRHELVFAQANNLFDADRAIPKPMALKAPWENVRTVCETVAKQLPLCKYLGLKNSDGT